MEYSFRQKIQIPGHCVPGIFYLRNFFFPVFNYHIITLANYHILYLNSPRHFLFLLQIL